MELGWTKFITSIRFIKNILIMFVMWCSCEGPFMMSFQPNRESEEDSNHKSMGLTKAQVRVDSRCHHFL